MAARWVAGGLALAALAGLVLAACDGDSGPADPTTSSSSSSTPTTVDEEAAVIEAYLAELDAFYAAANPPNPDHPALDETMTGAELASVRENLRKLAEQGHGIRRGEQHSMPRVTSLSSRTAMVLECAVDDDVTFDLATGDVVDDRAVEGIFETRLVRDDGKWKVERTTFTEGPCDR